MSPISAEQNLGLSVLKGVMDALGDDWDDLSDVHRANAAAVSMDYAALVLRATWGDDVTDAMREVSVAVAQWTWIGEDVARRAMVEAVGTGLKLGLKVAVKAIL